MRKNNVLKFSTISDNYQHYENIMNYHPDNQFLATEFVNRFFVDNFDGLE